MSHDFTDVLTEDDHARGCEGRNYACTCGYDERVADEIKRLRAQRDGASELMDAASAEIERLRARVAELEARRPTQPLRTPAGRSCPPGTPNYPSLDDAMRDGLRSIDPHSR